MNIEIKFLDTKKNIYSDNAAHMVRHIGAWGGMTEHEFLRVLEAAYELQSMHSDNWSSFTDAAGEEIERYEAKGVNHLTIVFMYWYLPDELKKVYMDINEFFCRNIALHKEKEPNSKIIFIETLIFPIENREEIIKLAQDNNFEYFLRAVVE